VKNLTFWLNVILLLSCNTLLWSQSVRINEIQSSNISTIPDLNGEFHDWIELQNYGFSGINIEGWGLSDDPDEPFKWVFPQVLLAPRGYLQVFASGKKNQEWPNHWETVIDQGDNWRYFVGTHEPPVGWKLGDFNDSTWQFGPSGFGYGDSDDATVIPRTISVYLRKSFVVEEVEDVTTAILHVDFDDGFVAYLNGTEISRVNLGDPGSPVPFDRQATTWKEARIYRGGSPDAFILDQVKQLLRRDGEKNVLAVQGHNISLGSSDLTIIPFLTLGLKTVPTGSRGVPAILWELLPSIHTNFKINSDGETVVLTDPTGKRVDKIKTGWIPADSSKGRDPVNPSLWFIYANPTPGEENGVDGVTGLLTEPRFSHEAGFYTGVLDLSLKTDSMGAVVRYTLDGSEPTESSRLYSGTINIDTTTVVRARAFKTGFFPSRIVTNTYLINPVSDLPIVSLTTDPSNFFNPVTGIYIQKNIENDWERPIHVEFFEPDGELGFSLDAGVRLYGGWTRELPQKSLAIFARSKYGANEINYRVFPDKPIESFEALVLRNSGNDWYTMGSSDDYWPFWKAVMFRDGLMTTLVDDLEVDTQAYRPAIVFLNGDYWGIHNIREKINEHFVAANNQVDPDDLDLLEQWGYPVIGDNSEYLDLMSFVDANSLVPEAKYEVVTSQINIDSFIDYYLSQIYFANTDWPGNNVKFWKPQSADGKWRWILYDTDFGFGLAENASHNTLQFALDDNGPEWPNPPWSNLLFRRLIENRTFQGRFLSRFCLLAETNFNKTRVSSLLEQTVNTIQNEMPHHIARWGGDFSHWNWSVSLVRAFVANRLAIVKNQIASHFGLSGMSDLILEVYPKDSGFIEISEKRLTGFPWSGEFFDGVPIELHPVSNPGFVFSHWQEDPNSDTDLNFFVDGDRTLTAVFEARELDANIVINEINYNSNPHLDSGDWIELYNHGNSAVNLEGWKVQDSSADHSRTLPDYDLNAGSYLVLCEDEAKFKNQFPEVTEIIGSLGFGLSGRGEKVQVFDQYGNLADSLEFSDQLPWPEKADGKGSTLELLNPDLDNTIASNWAASTGQGTPGQENGKFLVECTVDGDFDSDGVVTVTDLVLLINQVTSGYPSQSQESCFSDLNGDGYIDISDLVQLLIHLP